MELAPVKEGQTAAGRRNGSGTMNFAAQGIGSSG
jgi:hypothetical protein